MVNKIYPLLSNMIHPRNSAGPLFPDVPDVYTDSPIICYLIHAGEEWILVDTGACGETWSGKYHHKMTPVEPDNWDKLLAPFGLTPKDIKTIVNTHLHWDHCYNNDLFPNAKIYVQRKEVEFAINPVPSHYVYYEAFQIGMIPPWVASSGRFEIIEGELEIAEGVKLIPLPGHTPGFQGVLVTAGNGQQYLIAGDCVANLDNWYNRAFGQAVPSYIHVDLAVYYETLQRMTKMNAVILPGHDLRAFNEKVYPPEKA